MKKVNPLLEVASSYMKSRTVLTAAELDLFTLLHEQPRTSRELAARMGLDERALTRILDCLVTLALVEKQENRYTPTPEGTLLSSRHAETMLPMLLHLNSIWSNWGNLTQCVRCGTNPDLHDIVNAPTEDVARAFIGAMHAIGKGMAHDIASSRDLGLFTNMLDIGGASGTYSAAFLKQNQKLRATIFDLPAVIPLARALMAAEGLQDRVSFVPGDFYTDELPGGHDLCLLSAIIHQNSPAQNSQLYQKIFRCLKPGGTLLIRDHIMDETRTNPPEGALFALNMLVNTPGGDTYTFAEVQDTLLAAGFTDISLARAGQKMDCLVEAKKRS